MIRRTILNMALRYFLRNVNSVCLFGNTLERSSVSSITSSYLRQSSKRRKHQEIDYCGFTSSSKMTEMVVPTEEVERFISDCMKKAGTTSEDAETVAHHLMTADYRGHFSHGLNRMSMYVHEINDRITDPTAKPEVINDFQVRSTLLYKL